MSAGRTCKAYVQIGGTYANPTWVEMKRISNVQRPKSRSTSDRMYRGAKNKKKVLGYIEQGFSFVYQPKKSTLSDNVLAALEGSLDSETILDVLFLDGLVTTAAVKGVRCPVMCSKLDRKEDDEDAIQFDVELVEVEDYDDSGDLRESVAYTVAGS
jgi:hypothetical protein